jgi:hypothetical protein
LPWLPRTGVTVVTPSTPAKPLRTLWGRHGSSLDCLQRAPPQIGRFKVGQTVVAPSGGPGESIPRGPLVIVRLLPLVDGEPQYRVRSEADGLDRVVLERQIQRTEDRLPKALPSKPTRGRR